MLIYLTSIVVGLEIVFLVNMSIAITTASFTILYAFLLTILNFVVVFLTDAIVAAIIHALPRKWFNPYQRGFIVGRREVSFYDKMRIKKWKDRIPEMGQLCDFKKDKIQTTEKDYMFKFLEETCYAEIVHYGMCLAGIVNILVFFNYHLLNFTLPIILVNFILNIPPILIQRYNRPKLLKIYEIQKKKEEKEERRLKENETLVAVNQ